MKAQDVISRIDMVRGSKDSIYIRITVDGNFEWHFHFSSMVQRNR